MDCVPAADLAPDQAPEAVHEVALLADHVRVALPPVFTALGPTLSETVGAAALTETVVADWALPPLPAHVRT